MGGGDRKQDFFYALDKIIAFMFHPVSMEVVVAVVEAEMVILTLGLPGGWLLVCASEIPVLPWTTRPCRASGSEVSDPGGLCGPFAIPLV